MNYEAREKLKKFIANYGAAVCNTPRSCEMFLLTQLADYPDERKVLVEALRQGAVTKLLAREGGRSWDSLSYELAQQLRTAASLSEEDAAWAIDSWGLALGKHPESVAVTAEAPPPPPPDQDPNIRNEDNLKLKAFTPIVAVGGAAGSGVGALLLGIVFFLFVSAGGDVATKFAKKDPRIKEAVAAQEVASFALVMGLVGAAAVSGGVGGGLGWFVGRGTSNPWAGFWTTFSAGLIASAVATRLCPCFGTVLVSFIATFGAALSSAYGLGGR
jgi:hypothetical protein